MNRTRSNYLIKQFRTFGSSSRIYYPRKFRSDSLSKHTNQFGEYSIIRPNQCYRNKISEIDIDTIIPKHIIKPDYAYTSQPAGWSEFIELKDEECLLQDFREACQLAKRALKLGGSLCLEGVTTDRIDEKVREYIVSQGGYPSTLNYMGFPNSICTSINNVICHGIPDSRPLHSGDIINIDVTVYYKGFHGDTSATFLVGEVDELGLELTEVTKMCLDKAIGICGPKVPLKEIGSVIEETANKYNFSISEELTGHGIGRMFHEIPLILHHVNEESGHMIEGMSFTIEPILCQGTSLGLKWDDNWTIVTKDGGRSAQFEHTIIITSDGAEILTK